LLFFQHFLSYYYHIIREVRREILDGFVYNRFLKLFCQVSLDMRKTVINNT